MVMLAALTVIASACSHTDDKPAPVVVKYLKADVPPSSRIPCTVTPLPDRALSAQEVTAKWGPDRAEVLSCDARRAAAVAAIDTIPAQETTP